MANKLALLAHSTQMDSLVSWIEKYQGILANFQLMMTKELQQRLQQETEIGEISVTLVDSLENGGDIIIATQILAGNIGGVFFFVDSQTVWLDYPSFHMLLRTCQAQNIPLVLNEASADLVIRGYTQSRIAYLIFNPVAGNGNAAQDLALIRLLLEPQILVNVICTEPDVDPIEQTKEAIALIQAKASDQNPQNNLIIASGGDGTVSAVASAVVGTDIPLGIIPRGTANAFSVALGIPTNLRGACETILAGNTRVVDAACCNDIPMILLAGFGFEAGMVHKANRELKNRLGSLAYVFAGVQQFAEQQPFKAVIEINDKITELETTAITVANVAPPTSVLAQGFGEVIPDDGLLDITISTSKTRLEGLNALTSLFTSALVKQPTNQEALLCLRTNRIKVSTEPPQKLVVDGEIFETSSVDIQCLPNALTVLTPFSQ